MRYRVKINGVYRSFKRGRIVFQLHYGEFLESWELINHKDGNRFNDFIDNLEVLNAAEINAKNPNQSGKKPEGWKPANTTPKETIQRIKEIASGMIKINCSEISRRLKQEGISITSFTIKRLLVSK